MNTPFAWFLVALASFSTVSFAVPPPPTVRAAFERGEMALSISNLEAAEAAYREAIDAAPGYAPALNGLGSVLFKQKKMTEACVQFRAAADAEPTFKLAWFNLGYAARKSSDFATAILAYEKYTTLDPKDPDGFFGLADSYREAGQRESAIAAYEAFLARESRPTEQRSINRAKERIAELKAGPPALPTIAGSPVTATPVKGLSVADGDKAWAEKRFGDANVAFQDVVNANPKDVEALFKLGNTFAVLGDYARAIETWGMVQKVSDDPAIRTMAADNIERARLRQQGVKSPVRPTSPSPTATSRPQSLPFGIVEHPERGRLEVGSSHRVAGSFWEFVVTYTNTTGAAFRQVTVECITLVGRRALNANTRSEFDGVPAGETLILKVPVEDVAEPAEIGSCRVSKAQR